MIGLVSFLLSLALYFGPVGVDGQVQSSGLHYFTDFTCTQPIPVPNTHYPWLKIPNSSPLRTDIGTPFPGGSIPNVNCITMNCRYFNSTWVPEPPSHYDPYSPTNTIYPSLGFAYDPSGICDHDLPYAWWPISLDLTCFTFPDGITYAAVDCFGLIQAFPPAPMPIATSSTGSSYSLATH